MITPPEEVHPTGPSEAIPGPFNALVELSPEAICVLVEKNIAYANAAMLSLCRAKSPSELLGRSFLELLAPDSRLLAQATLSEVLLTGGSSPVIPLKILHGEESPVWVEALVGIVPWQGNHSLQVLFRPLWGHPQAFKSQLAERQGRAGQAALDYAIFTLDQAGRISSWNSESEKLFGYPSEEILGREINLLFPPEQRDKALEPLAQAASQGRVESDEWLVRKNGSLVHTHDVIIPVRQADGQLSGFMEVAREIHPAESLLAPDEEFQQLKNHPDAIFWEWSLVQDRLSWNRAASAVLGYQPHELGSSLQFWTDGSHPEDGAKTQQQLRDLFTTESPSWAAEYRFRRRDGSYARVLDRGCVIKDNLGKPTRLVSCMVDLGRTHLREQEAVVEPRRETKPTLLAQSGDTHFEALAGVVPFLVLTLNAECIPLFVNRHWTHYTGLSLDETKAAGWSSIIHEADKQTVIQLCHGLNSLSTPRLFQARFLKHDDQTYQWHLGHVIPLLSPQGQITQWLLVGTNSGLREAQHQELLQLNEALQQNASQWQSLLNVLPIGIAITEDLSGQSFRLNSNLSLSLGLSNPAQGAWITLQKEAALPFDAYRGNQQLSLEDLPQFLAMRQQKAIRDFEFTIVLPGGKTIDFLAYAVPVFGTNNRLQGAVAAFWDITSRKKTEQALSQSQERYRAFMMNSSEGIWLFELREPIDISLPVEEQIDRLFQFCYLAECNQEMARIYHFATPEEMVGLPLEFFHPRSDPNSHLLLTSCIRANYLLRDVPLSMAAPGGAERYLNFNLYGIIEKGLLLRAWGTKRDITDRFLSEQAIRRSEERFRHFYESNLVGVAFWTLDGTITEANDAYLRIIGYSQAEFKAMGQLNWHEHTPPEFHPLDDEAIKECLVSGKSHIYEKEYITRTGARVPVAMGLAFLNHGRQDGVAFVLDITERKKADEALQSAKAQLERQTVDLEKIVSERTSALQQTIKFLEGFCYSIAHDLRAPLRAMSGLTALLLEDYGTTMSATAQDYARRIMDAARHMDNLTRDLLVYGQLSHTELTFSWVSLAHKFATLLAQHEEEIKNRKAIVLVEQPLPQVWANPTVLEQILTNLLSNSLKFQQPGVAPEIRIRAQNFGTHVRISIQDNGIGMDPSHFERIFYPFEQLHEKERFPGTGIGLAIVRKGIERLGGIVGVQSQVGIGSTFWIEIPNPGEKQEVRD